MNKTKLIALSLVLALVLMGTAFAWWTDSHTVKNVVKTGNLSVSLEGDGENPKFHFRNSDGTYGPVDINGLGVGSYGINENNYTFEITNGNSLNVEINNAFPGLAITYCYNIVNNGTVPARVNGVELVDHSPKESNELLERIYITFDLYLLKANGEKIEIRDNGDLIGGSYKEIAGKIQTALNAQNIVLLPGDKIIVGNPATTNEDVGLINGFAIYIPESWVGNEAENETMSFELKFNYIQANEVELP